VNSIFSYMHDGRGQAYITIHHAGKKMVLGWAQGQKLILP
jgi:hypothetical protein